MLQSNSTTTTTTVAGTTRTRSWQGIAALFAMLAVTSVLTGCGKSNAADYPDSARTAFMGSCMVKGTQPLCDCTWKSIAKSVPWHDFVKYDVEIRSGTAPATPDWLTNAITDCVS